MPSCSGHRRFIGNRKALNRSSTNGAVAPANHLPSDIQSVNQTTAVEPELTGFPPCIARFHFSASKCPHIRQHPVVGGLSLPCLTDQSIDLASRKQQFETTGALWQGLLGEAFCSIFARIK
jgi:hypothetical protein